MGSLVRSVPGAAQLTIYMCWHRGAGHGFPQHVMDAALRLRERHLSPDASDEDYTSLAFAPSAQDAQDFLVVAPFSDLAYATDADGQVRAEVSGAGHGGASRRSVPRRARRDLS